jgi:hypothetical protein
MKESDPIVTSMQPGAADFFTTVGVLVLENSKRRKRSEFVVRLPV